MAVLFSRKMKDQRMMFEKKLENMEKLLQESFGSHQELDKRIVETCERYGKFGMTCDV